MSHGQRNEIDSNDKMAELALWWARNASGGGSGGAPPIIVASIAQLESTPSSTYRKGQFAVVQSIGALWTIDPASTFTSDGITVVPAANGGRWFRSLSLFPEQWINQISWFIDELNITGTASDENDGLTRSTAILHKAEAIRRMGTLTPFTNVATTFIWVSVASLASQATDPWISMPTTGPGGSWLLTCDFANLAPVFSGVLGTVTPKSTNTNPGNALEAVIASGAIAPSVMLVNDTRGGSVAFTQRILSGSNWLLTQPQAAWTPGTFPAIFPSNEDNTWATGDSIRAFALPNIDAGVFGSIASDLPPSFYGGLIVNRLGIASSNFSATKLTGGQLVMTECSISKQLLGNMWGAAEDAFGVPIFSNCSLRANGYYGGPAVFSGGAVTIQGDINGASFSGDVTITNLSSGNLGRCRVINCTLGRVFLDSGVLFTTDGACSSLSVGTETLILYGTGTANFMQYMNYSNGSPTGTNAFRCAINIGFKGTAYSASTDGSGVTTIRGGIALSGAALDAPAGPTGFGGQAFNLGGASITNTAQN